MPKFTAGKYVTFFCVNLLITFYTNHITLHKAD